MSNKHIEEMAKDLQETHDYEGCEAWHCGGCRYEKYSKNYFCSSIKQAEKMTAKDYRKQIRGEWIEIPINNYDGEPSGLYYVCSVCHTDGGFEDTPFCPNCGAEMKRQ